MVDGKRYSGHKLALAAGLLLSLSLTIATAQAAPGSPPTFTVNSTSDIIAAGPLDDGHCATVYNGGQPNNICTLRAAVMKANHWPGGGATIILPALPAGADYALTILMSGPDDETTGDLNINANMSLRGGGAAGTIIDDQSGLTQDRAFIIGSGVVARLSGVTIEGGQVNGDGGGIYNAGQLTLDHSAVISNTADNAIDGGGGIFNFLGTLTVTHTLIGGNSAHLGLQGGNGGGLDSYIGKATIVASTISGNHATGGGGGIFSTTPNLTVYSSTIVANTSSDGGGLYGYGNGGVMTLLATTVNSNTASNDGGGLDLKSGTANLVDSTISGNGADLDGGGIYNSSGCTCGNPSEVDLFNATVANNFADADLNGSGTGGGVDTVASSDNTTKLQNSLVASNWDSQFLFHFYVLRPNDCVGTLTNLDYNLLGTTDGCTFTSTVHDHTDVAALLDPLLNYGGPTLTQALQPGSPAIDAGNPGGCRDQAGALLTTDQRGRPRTANGALATLCDIGAFELQRIVDLPLVRR